jgi:hypothetical protein
VSLGASTAATDDKSKEVDRMRAVFLAENADDNCVDCAADGVRIECSVGQVIEVLLCDQFVVVK